jgi:hypothetical protein
MGTYFYQDFDRGWRNGMGLSGVVVFLCVIERSAHLTDSGRPGVMPCQSVLRFCRERRWALINRSAKRDDAPRTTARTLEI